MFIHDVIKIQYVNIGYLPNRPYALISDKEMFEAFLKGDECFFSDFYPCPAESMQEKYDALKTCIQEKIAAYLENPTEVEIPSWVYSYMLMTTITYESENAEISYLYDLLNMETPTGLPDFNEEVATRCYEESEQWLKRIPSVHIDRPPTMFGEPHVIKSLRLQEANVLIDEVTV